MISILNYGVGNLASVARMIEKLGEKAIIISTPEEIKRAKKIILPGVGHFDHGMSRISELNFLDPLKYKVTIDQIPILGICLGMQLLCICSEEGSINGLGFVDAEVLSLKSRLSNYKVPHMGWNELDVCKNNQLIDRAQVPHRYYFVHSYYVQPNNNDIIIAKSHYGFDFCAAFQFKNIYGVQFHPEKSHKYGMQLMGNFINL